MSRVQKMNMQIDISSHVDDYESEMSDEFQFDSDFADESEKEQEQEKDEDEEMVDETEQDDDEDEVKAVKKAYRKITNAQENRSVFLEKLEESQYPIQKNSQVITFRIREMKSKEDEISKQIDIARNNFHRHLEEIANLSAKIKLLEEIVPSFEGDIERLEEDYREVNQKIKKLINQSSTIEKLVSNINKKKEKINSTEMSLEDKVKKGDIVSWSKNDIGLLLESLKLEKWLNPMKKFYGSKFGLQVFCEHDSIRRLTCLYSGFTRMKYGEAKYLSLVVESIKDKKVIPKCINDIDLDEKKMQYWTIENVKNYFILNGMPELADHLSQLKVNGLVLINTTDEVLENLGSSKSLVKDFEKFLQRPDGSFSTLELEYPPDDLLCPITGSVMENPVIALDGFTYEKENIERYLLQNYNRSPTTGSTIEAIFEPNIEMQEKCRKWKRLRASKKL
eukprot:c20148_g1_i1.p1 GENE.c20148_g1_i1~~c20148_g1_i1.p1  ORF type:complete len:450 (+),score=78.40 c20148_g1_i1:153-1502(+)